MADGTVGWHFFDVESGNLPEECSPSVLPGGGRGRIVVLAASPFALSRSWAARAAVAIAREWAEQGLRIFLMDLGLDAPTLHDLLGLPNEEGVSDAFLYGASVQRIARQALDGTIYFASAGTATADPEEVLGHPRWSDLAGGFSEADATLLLFLPAGTPGSGRVLSLASDIVFLAAQGESADQLLGPSSIKVTVMVGPLGSPPERSPEAEPQVSASSPHDIFGASLELASGFGEEAPPEEEVLDFELAEGFDLPSAPSEEEGEGRADEASETPPSVEDTEEVPAQDRGGFGSDLVMGANIAGTLGAERRRDGSGDAAQGGPPDFGAEFVDLPPADEEGEGFGRGGDFGDALVQGPDFGVPAPATPDGGASPRATTGGPGGASPEAPAPRVDRDILPQEQARAAPKRRKPPKKKFPVARTVISALVVVFLLAVVGTALGYLNVPGLTFLQEYFGELPEPPLTVEGPRATGPTLGYSVALRGYREDQLAFAAEMQDALLTALPGFHYILVPEDTEAGMRYFLMAGPAVDLADADSLRSLLTMAMPREDPSSWSVVETPRAFLLGRRDTFAEAEERRASVEALGIPAYILQATFEDGTERYQVLSGAYAGAVEARPLQLILRDAGFRDAPLIERRGRLPE